MIYKPRKFARNILMLSALCVCSAAAMAQSSSEKSREIILAPYLWAASIDGTSTVGMLPPLAIVASFSDLASNLDMAFAMHTEFRFNDWVFVIDPTYLSLSMDAALPPPVPAGTTLDVEVEIWLVELWAGYRLNENWEAIGGVRYQSQDISIGGLPLPVTSAGVSANWSDWFVGTRFKTDISEKWFMLWRADVTIAGDSDTSWNTSIFFNRRVGKKGNKALNLGYRYFVDDFVESGVYAWDVTQDGPVIGFTWVF
jgi:hypothetical protein